MMPNQSGAAWFSDSSRPGGSHRTYTRPAPANSDAPPSRHPAATRPVPSQGYRPRSGPPQPSPVHHPATPAPPFRLGRPCAKSRSVPGSSRPGAGFPAGYSRVQSRVACVQPFTVTSTKSPALWLLSGHTHILFC